MDSCRFEKISGGIYRIGPKIPLFFSPLSSPALKYAAKTDVFRKFRFAFSPPGE